MSGASPPAAAPAAAAQPGALAGVRVLELAGLGPAPVAAMLLADMGAEVTVVERPGAAGTAALNVNRGKRSIALDLKHPAGCALALRLLDHADVLIEGMRPGVMERLGLGPDVALARRPALVYARVTGWGQTGPLAHAAGHDLNYVALTGALATAQRPGALPALPITLVGDMGGGALFAAFGIVCALLEARSSGRGQVVDAAMVDGVAALGALVHAWRALGQWSDDPAANPFLHTAPFYDSYRCADGGAITLGPLEPQFWAEALRRLGLEDVDPAQQYDSATWPALKARLQALFAQQPRAHWCALLEGTDACFAPVLSLDEAARHPHLAARATFVEVDGQRQPAVAPRLSRTPGRTPGPAPAPGRDTDRVLAALGCTADERARWRAEGVCG